MKLKTALGMLLAATLLMGTVWAAGDGDQPKTPAQQRAEIDQVSQDTLAQVYQKYPKAKAQIEHAAGYAVFRTGGVQVLVLGGGGGNGVAVGAGKRTYMNVVQGKVGIGLGAKETRQVLVFLNQKAFDKFIRHGWIASGDASASAKAGNVGAQVSGAAEISKGIYAYQFAENGLTAEVTLSGSKYMVDNSLNVK